MRCDEKQREILQESGLLDVGSVLSRADMEVVKSQAKGRQVVRFRLADGRLCYVKRYDRVGFWPALRARLFSRGYSCDAMREWLALRRASDAGVPVIQPLVVGEVRALGLVRRAFVATLDGGRDSTLEEVALNTVHDLRSTAEKVAQLLARLHKSGVNHRDFYLGHLLMDRTDTNGETICLMDFNRADVRGVVGKRWRVKDLAALHFSLPARRMSDRGRLRFLLEYTGKDGPRARDLAALIVAKAERMRRHARNMLDRGEPNIHINS